MKPRYELFLAEFLSKPKGSRNATQSAIKAGWSEKSAHTQGCRLLERLDIAGAVAQHDARSEKQQERVTAQAGLNADRVLAEISKLAFSSLQDCYDEDGNINPINDLPPNVAATISQIEHMDNGRGGVKKLKQQSKLQALDLAVRVLGMAKQMEAQASVNIILANSLMPAPIGPADKPKILPVWE
jgi:phage terminase small subunit